MSTLDEYRVGTTQPPGSRPLIVTICTRPHRTGGAWAGFTARDFDGDQTDLTLGELIEQAEAHEAEEHPEGASG